MRYYAPVRITRSTTSPGYSTVGLLARESLARAGWAPEDANCTVRPADEEHLGRRIYPEGAVSISPPEGTVVERPEASSPSEARRMIRWTRYSLPCGRVMMWRPKIGFGAESP